MKYNINFQATGTTWNIDYYLDVTLEGTADAESLKNDLMEIIKHRLNTYENTYSRFRKDSLVANIAKGETSETKGIRGENETKEKIKESIREYLFPEDAKNLFELYRKMYEATGGLVTPLIGKVISDAGYDSNYSLQPKTEILSAKKWGDVMSYKHPILTVYEPISLDFGAIGKGYAIDLIAQLLIEQGLKEFTINAGGDICHHSNNPNSNNPIRIGLEHPHNPKQVIGVAEITNKSICGSAGNRRAWGDFHHIMNPETVTSPKHISAVWVITSGPGSTAVADALTTGLFFVEPTILSQRLKIGFEYLIVYADNTMKKSSGFTAEVF